MARRGPNREDEFLHRVDVVLKTRHRAQTNARAKYVLTRGAMLVSAGAIPVLLSVQSTPADFVAALLSVVLLLTIALDWGANPRDDLRRMEHAVTLLESEKNLYLSRAGPYTELAREKAGIALMERVEAINVAAELLNADARKYAGDSNLATQATSAGKTQSSNGAAIGNYDGRVVAWTVMEKGGGSIWGRLLCQLQPSVVVSEADRETAKAEKGMVQAKVLVQGGSDLDPVTFSLKVLSISDTRVTAFPRSANLTAPLQESSEEFEFVLVESSRERRAEGADDEDLYLLIDVSQIGRTIQIFEVPLERPLPKAIEVEANGG